MVTKIELIFLFFKIGQKKGIKKITPENKIKSKLNLNKTIVIHLEELEIKKRKM